MRPGGELAGKGQDLHGAFTLQGNFRFDTGVATFTKHYPTYDLPYRGRITSNGLAGTWGARRWYHRVPSHTHTHTTHTAWRVVVPRRLTGCRVAHTKGRDVFDLAERGRHGGVQEGVAQSGESSDAAARPTRNKVLTSAIASFFPQAALLHFFCWPMRTVLYSGHSEEWELA